MANKIVFANIPVSIRMDWMQSEYASFQEFEKTAHPCEHEDHVYKLIQSNFSTNLAITCEKNLVALIISASTSSLRKEKPDDWKKVFFALEKVARNYGMSAEGKSLVSSHMFIRNPIKEMLTAGNWEAMGGMMKVIDGSKHTLVYVDRAHPSQNRIMIAEVLSEGVKDSATPQEMMANANVIAASKDMYLVLKELLDAGIQIPVELKEQALAAIDKAEGAQFDDCSA